LSIVDFKLEENILSKNKVCEKYANHQSSIVNPKGLLND